jgi:hypothetical protein
MSCGGCPKDKVLNILSEKEVCPKLKKMNLLYYAMNKKYPQMSLPVSKNSSFYDTFGGAQVLYELKSSPSDSLSTNNRPAHSEQDSAGPVSSAELD